MHHVMADVDRTGKPLGIRIAVAFDDNAVQSEKHAAIGFSRIHLVGQ